jgi:carboxypeptidase Q
MRQILATISLLTLGFLVMAASKDAAKDPASDTAEKLRNEVLVNGHAYSDLVELVKIGGRLSGSQNAALAVEWGKHKMESYGFDNVWLQPVTVPKWERGPLEQAMAILKKHKYNLRVTALGNSVGTPAGGVRAQVIEVHGLDEVTALGDQVKGKIIFYNRPMDPSKVNTFEAYGGGSDQRFAGPARAAKFGAVAVLVRSLTLRLDDHPHTGATHYDSDGTKIPAAALSTNDAERLSALLKKEPDLTVRLELSAKQLGTVASFNVIGELTGRDKPDEYVLVGGHLDSWDLAQGAQDDGAGIVQSIEALRAIRALGLHPRRSLRTVLFMSEEMGGLGGVEYAKQAKEKGEKHLAALESDNGGFTPLGFSVQGSDSALEHLRAWGKYLVPAHADLAIKGHGETDIEPLGDLGVTLFSFVPDSQRYFDYHHAETDTIEAVNPRELQLGASAMSVLAWLLAEQGL